MYIAVSFFFLMVKLAKLSALKSIVPVWADLKSQLFWILAFFFFLLPGPPVGNEFQMDRLLFLFDAVAWNPFIMKTTFTSDLSWFVSNV